MRKRQKAGISLIALIITIIVIVILAGIVITTSINVPESAKFAKFASEMGALQDAISLTYLDIYSSNTRLSDDEIYSGIAGGGQYLGTLPEGLEDSEIAWRIESANKINGIDILPDYGELYLTDKGIVFLGGTGYAYGDENYITASVKYEGESNSEITNNQIKDLFDRVAALELENITLKDRVSAIESSGSDGGISSQEVTSIINNKVLGTYPVGSIYISTSSANPSTFIGGTWEAFGQGRTLIGDGTNSGYTFTSGSTGTTLGAITNPLGEYKHTLVSDEMPSHNHSIAIRNVNLSGSAAFNAVVPSITTNGLISAAGGICTRATASAVWGLVSSSYRNATTEDVYRVLNIDASHTHTATIGTTGSDVAHNNIQPYIVTYMWQRID